MDFGEVYQGLRREEYQYLEKVKKYLKRQIHEEAMHIQDEIKRVEEMYNGIPPEWRKIINYKLGLIKMKLNWINNDSDGLGTYRALKAYAREKIERSEIPPELEDAIKSMREYFEHRRKYFECMKEICPPYKLQEFDPFLERRIEQLNEFIGELDSLERELKRE